MFFAKNSFQPWSVGNFVAFRFDKSQVFSWDICWLQEMFSRILEKTKIISTLVVITEFMAISGF